MELGTKSTRGRGVRRWAITTLLGLLAVAGTGTAAAQTAAPGFNVANFATGFETNPRGLGPIGLAFGPAGTLFVSDAPNGHVYEFGPGGGVAGASTQITPIPSPFPREDARGLAFGRSGELYLALANSNRIVQIDPADGSVIRDITNGVPCPVGLAVDPVSGDLFATSPACSTSLWRITGTTSPTPTATRYATNLADLDGIAFAPNGELWAAAQSGPILRIGGTASPAPGAVTPVANVPQADGVAIQADASGAATALFINGIDGNVTRLDLSNNTTSPVMTGGSRGDFMVAGADGALYATQTDRVLRITASGGGNNPNGGAIPGVVPNTPGNRPRRRLRASDVIRLRAANACLRRHRVRIRLVRFRGVTFRTAVIRVNGRKARTLRGGALRRPVTLTRLRGRGARVKVTVTTRSGRKFTLTRRYRFCARR